MICFITFYLLRIHGAIGNAAAYGAEDWEFKSLWVRFLVMFYHKYDIMIYAL